MSVYTGNRANVTPVSADIVAQVVAEAQRKIQMGVTPPIDVGISYIFIMTHFDIIMCCYVMMI